MSARLRKDSEDSDFKKSKDKEGKVNSALEIPSLGYLVSKQQQRGGVKSYRSLLTYSGRCGQK